MEEVLKISSLDIIIARNQQEYLDKEYENLKISYPNTKNFALKIKFQKGVYSHKFSYIDFKKFTKLILDIDLTSNNDIIIEFNECKFNKICDYDNCSKNKYAKYELSFKFKQCSFENESEIELNTLYQQVTDLEYKIKFEFFDYEKCKKKDREKVSIKIKEDETLIEINSTNTDIINSTINGKCNIISSSNTKISKTKFNKKIEIEDSEIEFEDVEFLNEIKFKNDRSSCIKNSTIQNLVCSEGAKSLEFSNTTIANFTFNGEITDKAIFNKVTFKNPPEIGDIKFKNCNVEFRDVEFKDKKTPEAIAGFRALNKACRDANYHHGEIFFHGLTLEGIGKNLKYKSDFVEKSFSFFYKYFSDFGRSVNRPLCWLVGIFFFFIVINFVGIAINKINDLKLSQQSLINKLTVENNQILTKINDIKDIPTKNMEICEEKSRLINYLNSQQQLVSNKSIVENKKNCDEQFQLIKIYSKIIFKNAIGPLQLALPKDFISDCESKFYNQNSNSIIYFLNFFHAVISSAIWFIWFFMIRARFKL
jgi:hypothetical protein